MIIHNLYVAGITVRPYKAKSVFHSHPDRVLALAGAAKCLEGITRSSKVAKRLRRMEHHQFSEGDTLNSSVSAQRKETIIKLSYNVMRYT